MTAVESQLQLFWDRFRVCRPSHMIFKASDAGQVVLKRTLPFLIHGDEGRGKKKQGVLIVNAHSILGKGVATKRKRKPGTEQGMNYSGSTFCTRFVLGVLPKSWYEENDDAYFGLVDRLADDFSTLATTGITGPDNQRFWAATLYCKGDWPFLLKVGHLWRSFHNAPKKESSRTPCTGVCHLCDAGVPDVPYEDLTMKGEWVFTQGTTVPWTQYPDLLASCPHDRSFPATFFAPDPWHNWHLGEGRALVANCMKLICPLADGSNMDQKVDSLFEDYKAYCKQNRRQVYASRFSANMFNLIGNEFPSGSWTKGNFTTSLVKWLDHWLNSRRNTFEDGSLLMKAVP